MKQKIIIGLTGGIGSGKSVVARMLENYGIPVYNSDERAKMIMQTDKAVRRMLIFDFGKEVFINNELNRDFLAKKVFTSAENLKKLNKIVHPVLIDDFKKWTEKQQLRLMAMESAVIFESGLEQNFDFTIGVFANKSTRIQRVMSRSNLSKDDIKKRMLQQFPSKKLLKKVDFAIFNDKNYALIPQVEHILEELAEKR
ncbi:MAG: dephospho-CoA kinase [Prevotellaceae bacterium]|jgi:dephospho-CoA kinase|nr:dephospho-CoA kinase [Prevotellaceae bacterium]